MTRTRRQLSPITRLFLFVVGWVLVLIGIAGLVLASRTVHRLLRALLQHWPWLWKKIETFREKVHDKLLDDR